MAGNKPKSRWRRWLIEALIVLVVIIAIRLYTQRDVISGPVPPLQAVTLAGQAFSLQQQQGRPVLVHFWASWCPVCRLEQGAIQAIAQDHNVITVAMQSGDAAEVSDYLREEGLTFPVIVDEHGLLAQRFGVRGVPTSFVVDATGLIRFVEVGYTTGPGLRARLWWADNF